MFCTACAALNPRAADACRGCGRRLAGAGPPPAGRAAGGGARAAPPGSRLSSLLAAAPLVALVAVLLLFQAAERAGRDRVYARAEAAAAAGEYDAALAAFAAAAGHRDADARRAALAAALEPADDAYRRGVAALGAGRHDEAIAALAPVAADGPGHADAADLLAEARRHRAADLRRRADAAEAGHDWLAAEAALAALAAAEPADRALADRLAALRRHHAPIVFARDQALYLLGPDGGDEHLLTDAVPSSRPIWSPDRSRIAFVSPTGGGRRSPAALYVVDADGRNPTRLSGTAHPNAVPAWSADGARIAYASVAAYDLAADTGLIAVHLVDLATGRDLDVTSVTGQDAVTPTWSPTGDRLAFVSRPAAAADRAGAAGLGHVAVLDLASGTIANLSGDRLPDVVRVLWSPAGDRLLAFARSRGIDGGMPGVTRLLELGAADGSLTPIADVADAVNGGWSPAWAPDGARYAFLDGPSTLVVRDRTGGETRVETAAALSGAVTWSPDGRALLLAAADPTDPSVLVDLTNPIPTLGNLAVPFDPEWPTGTPQWGPLTAPPLPVVPTSGGEPPVAPPP